MNKEIAGEILKQLGGNKFIAMTGAKNFGVSHTGMHFMIPRHNNINAISISLTVWDTYRVEFKKIDQNGIKAISSFDNVYFDQLQELFTQQTGLYTHL